MIHRAILCIMIAVLLVTTIPATRVPALGAAQSWTQIANLSGAGGKPENTEPFTTHGGKVRFTFTVQPNSTGPVPFLAKMYPKGSPVTANELHRTQCIDCKGKQTDDLGSARAGSYYLNVITSRPWTLAIEETK